MMKYLSKEEHESNTKVRSAKKTYFFEVRIITAHTQLTTGRHPAIEISRLPDASRQGLDSVFR
jgi:hypothetical protein